MKFKLSDIAQALNAELTHQDAECNGISIDTRTLEPNNLYIPIIGPNFDGHDFIEQAKEKSASAVLVSKAIKTNIPQLKVNDTRIAIGL